MKNINLLFALPFLALSACSGAASPDERVTIDDLIGQWESTGAWRPVDSEEWQYLPPVRDVYLTVTAALPRVYVWQIGDFCLEQGFISDSDLTMEVLSVRGTCGRAVGETYIPEVAWLGENLEFKASPVWEQYILLGFRNELVR